MTPSECIYDLDLKDLQQRMADWGQAAFRARQIWQGLYKQLWDQASQFHTIPKALREQLESQFNFSPLRPTLNQKSSDEQTVKTLFALRDDREIEAVLMRYDERRTLCISTQAGCAMGCTFCATGQMGFKRHLSSGEIVAQVLHYARELRVEGQQVTNVVLMGMGEPFHNYERSMAAIDRLNDPDGFNLGARRFTVSTSGLVPAIRRFAAEKRQVNLAVSLHASQDEARSSVMPVNRRHPISELIQACRDYVGETGRRITFEWALIHGVNDTPEEAKRLASLLKGMICHVNAIPLNPTQGFEGKSTTRQRSEIFKRILEDAGIPCTIRIRRGIDIQAGCGQLATQSANATPPEEATQSG